MLSERSLLRYAAFTLLYAAQGFPYGLLSVAVPAYMAQQGLTPAQIGSYMGIILLPWSLKLINGPIMDRWSFLAMGRRRPWVLAGQAGMIGTSLVLVLLPDPLQHLAWLTACGFAVNFFTAFQDVATDGMAIEIVPVDEQPRANSFMWGGKALGKSGAIAAGAWLLDGYGLAGAMVAHTAAVGVVMLVPLLLRERPGERLLPWTRGQASEIARHLQLEGWRDIGRSLLKVFVWPVSLRAAACMFVFSLGSGFLDALLPVLTVQELGWDHTDYSELNATAGAVSAIIGALTGWMLIELLGRQRTIAAGAALLGLASVAMALMPELWAHKLTAQGLHRRLPADRRARHHRLPVDDDGHLLAAGGRHPVLPVHGDLQHGDVGGLGDAGAPGGRLLLPEPVPRPGGVDRHRHLPRPGRRPGGTAPAAGRAE